MKTFITKFAAAIFTVGASAADVYHGLEEGNSDLSRQRVSAEDFVGVQPSIGSGVERYHGWADGNPDLFKSDHSDTMDSGRLPNIYVGVAGNPDLHY